MTISMARLCSEARTVLLGEEVRSCMISVSEVRRAAVDARERGESPRGARTASGRETEAEILVF